MEGGLLERAADVIFHAGDKQEVRPVGGEVNHVPMVGERENVVAGAPVELGAVRGREIAVGGGGVGVEIGLVPAAGRGEGIV